MRCARFAGRLPTAVQVAGWQLSRLQRVDKESFDALVAYDAQKAAEPCVHERSAAKYVLGSGRWLHTKAAVAQDEMRTAAVEAIRALPDEEG